MRSPFGRLKQFAKSLINRRVDIQVAHSEEKSLENKQDMQEELVTQCHSTFKNNSFSFSQYGFF